MRSQNFYKKVFLRLLTIYSCNNHSTSFNNLIMDSKRLINSNCKQDLRHIVPLPSRLFPIFPTLTVFHEHYLFFSINYTKLIPISKHWTCYSRQKLCSSNPIFPWLPASCHQMKAEIFSSVPHGTYTHMHNIFLYDIYE